MAGNFTAATGADFHYRGTTDGGAPSTGQFVLGDWVETPTGIALCRIGGTPGTWSDFSFTPTGATVSLAAGNLLDSALKGRVGVESQTRRQELSLIARHFFAFSRTVTVDNTANAAKATGWPVKVSLTSGNMTFANAQPDGRDIQFRMIDGVTVLPHWIASWDAAAQTAEVWVRMPSIPARSVPIRFYYGNPDAVSTGDISKVFPAGADFKNRREAWAHPTLSAATTILPQDEGWESTSSAHTLDIIDFGAAGKLAPNGTTYRFWGWYGHYGADGIGLAFTNDLSGQWTKYASNPILDSTAHARWATVRQADDGTFHMMVQNTLSNDLRRYTSADGVTFAFAEIVAADSGYLMGNGFLFRDPATNDYVFWFFRQTVADDSQSICYRRAASIPALTQARTIEVSRSPLVWAAPAMAYFDGLYWLYTEDYDGSAQLWRTIVQTSPTPTGPFTACSNSRLLVADQPCARPFVVDGTLYVFHAQRVGQSNTAWTFAVRTASPARGIQAVPAIQGFPVHSYSLYGQASVSDDSTVGAGAPTPSVARFSAAAATLNVDKSILTPGGIPSDHILCARVKRNSAAGIFFGARASTPGARYRFDVGPTVAHIDTSTGWHSGGVHIATNTHGVTWDTATWYVVECECVGTALKMRLGATQVVSVTDATYAGAGWDAIETPNTTDFSVDYIYARPYDGGDPTVTVGSQTVADPTTRAARSALDLVGPSVLFPIGRAVAGKTAWPLANRGLFAQLYIPQSRPYRYARLAIGVASGNIQVGLVKLSGASLAAYSRVLNSGVIACPVAADGVVVDFGAYTPEPGDYALFLWADNTTVTLSWATSTGNVKALSCAQVDGLTTGVPASGAGLGWGAQGLIDVALTADV